MMISIILLFKSYALRLFDDSITDRVAIVLIFGVCFVQFKELLAHIRLQQDEPHVSNLNRSSIWLYRSFIGAVAVMFVLVKNIVSIELVSISGCVVLFASIPWLIHICSCRADKIYRELFNCACIYMSLKLQILWHWHYQGFGQLRFLQDTGTFFNIIREASFMILGAAVAITILFYGMSFVAVILLHGMRVMRRWHCAVPKLPDQCVD
jgi:hypothetical protein